jgi:multidrug efflux system membrane fusion protein
MKKPYNGISETLKREIATHVEPRARQRVAPAVLLISGLAASALLLTSGCARRKAMPVLPVPVSVARVTVRSAPLSLSAVGSVEPVETVSVKAQVGGVIDRVFFAEGQDVKAGQLLFQIDPRPFQVALDAAQALLARDRSLAANTEIQAKRYADLVQKDYVTREQYDSVRTQAEMLRSTVRADEAAVAQAMLNLDYAAVKAPISGRTGSLLVKRGNVVKANEAALVVINQIDPIRVNFSIPGNQLPLVQRYAARGRLEVRINGGQGGNHVATGHLIFFDNQVDPQTGTVVLKAECPNREHALWPGQFVDSELVLAMESAVLTMPAGAVVTGQDGTFVFVVGADKTVAKRPVTIKRVIGSVAVIDQGLKNGEMVVTDGQMRLIPGAAVQIKTGAPAKRRAS